MLKRIELGTPAAIGLALLPFPGFAWAYYTTFRQALRGDEMERRVGLEGLAIGFGLTAALVLLLGLLENGVPAGAMWVDFSDVASYSLAFALFGYWWAYRRYA
jgi:hypothetical protein